MARSLTVKQGSFCQKYLECGNASEAYRFAYNCEKMKPETIKRKAAEVMANGNVTATLNNLRAKAEERAELKMDEVVRLLSDAIMADVTDYVTPDGKIRVEDIQKMPVEKRRLIESIQATKDGVKISLMGKASAIERVSKMLGWDAPQKHEFPQAKITIRYTNPGDES